MSIVRACLAAASVLVLGACAAAAAGPPRSGTEPVTTWMTDQTGAPGKVIFMRNNTGAPVTITSITLYDCENVRNPCLQQQLTVRLDPGATREVLRVGPQRQEQSFRFRYRFGW